MKALAGWREEKRSAYLYRLLAQVEDDGARRVLFDELAGEADKQAAMWERQVIAGGGRVPERFRPDLRARVVARLLRAFGPRSMRGVLAAMKVRGMVLYAKGQPGHYMSPQGPTASAKHDGAPAGAAVPEGEHRHRGVGAGGNLRAAVFGVNDGLISNTSLILGVAGATTDVKIVLLSGVAGLAAGAFSMAAGEYVSVRSQREMYEYQIALEREELEHYPEAEAEELALIYAARGVEKEQAVRMATAITADPARALDTLAREELGLNPDELGSPWGAAAFSFVSFAAGSAIPLLPFLVTTGPAALLASSAGAGAALFVVGACLSLFTGRSALRSGLRMLAIGAVAGGVTFGVGRLLGVALS